MFPRNGAMTPKEENLPADIKKVHRLIQRGRIWFCACGMSFMNATTRRDAECSISMHQKAVVELIEDNRAGRSHYGDE